MNQIQEDKFLKPYRNMQFISDMDPDSFIRKIKGEVRRRQTVHRRAMTSGIAVASIVLLFSFFRVLHCWTGDSLPSCILLISLLQSIFSILAPRLRIQP